MKTELQTCINDLANANVINKNNVNINNIIAYLNDKDVKLTQDECDVVSYYRL